MLPLSFAFLLLLSVTVGAFLKARQVLLARLLPILLVSCV